MSITPTSPLEEWVHFIWHNLYSFHFGTPSSRPWEANRKPQKLFVTHCKDMFQYTLILKRLLLKGK